MQELDILASVFYHKSFRLPKWNWPAKFALAEARVGRSVTIETMSSNSESKGEERESGANGFSQSSTLVTAPPLKPSGTTELHATPLRPGDVARRLQAEDAKGREGTTLPSPAGDLQPVASPAPPRLVHAALSDANRGTYLRFLGGGEFHPVAFSVHRPAADGDSPRLPLHRDVQRGAGVAARLSAQQQGLRHPQPAVSGQRKRSRPDCCRW